jgi:hypothetical protein
LLFISALFLAFAGSGHSTRAATLTVSAGGNLQAAINAAQPGDTINVEAGATFVGPISLPVKYGDAYVTIQSSRAAELPEGVRVTPAQSYLMPKIVAPGQGTAAISTVNGSHHYRLVGIEVMTRDAATFAYDLVLLGDASSYQSSLEQVPRHISIDRCYIHAWADQALKRGIFLNSAHTEVINSHISGFKAVGQEAQAILGCNGQGPFRIENNYLEGAGENVMFGGCDPTIPNLVPSDITIRRNHFFKPLAWRGVWQVKNTLELKNAKRVLIEGNLFENCWADAQAGVAIVFTVRNQYGGAPWSEVSDVTFQNNIVRNAASGVSVFGQDALSGVKSQQTKNIVLRNNLWENLGSAWSNPGLSNSVFLAGSGANDLGIDGLHVERNTVKNSDAQMFYFYGAPTSGFRHVGNIAGYGGITGDEMSPGFSTLDRYVPGYVVTDNDLINVYRCDLFPAGNDCPATEAGAHPSTTRGVDMAALEAAQGGAYPNPTPGPSPTPTPAPSPSPGPSPTPTPTPTPAPTPSAPVVSIVSPDSGALYGESADIVVTTEAVDNDGYVNKVELYAGSTLIGVATSAPYNFNWSKVPAGEYYLAAKAIDNSGMTTTSAPVKVSVKRSAGAVNRGKKKLN